MPSSASLLLLFVSRPASLGDSSGWQQAFERVASRAFQSSKVSKTLPRKTLLESAWRAEPLGLVAGLFLRSLIPRLPTYSALRPPIILLLATRHALDSLQRALFPAVALIS